MFPNIEGAQIASRIQQCESLVSTIKQFDRSLFSNDQAKQNNLKDHFAHINYCIQLSLDLWSMRDSFQISTEKDLNAIINFITSVHQGVLAKKSSLTANEGEVPNLLANCLTTFRDIEGHLNDASYVYSKLFAHAVAKSTMEGMHKNISDSILKYETYRQEKEADLLALTAKLSAAINTASKKSTEIETSLSDLGILSSAYKSAIARKELSVHGLAYKDMATNYRSEADRWRNAMFATMTATFTFSVVLWFTDYFSNTELHDLASHTPLISIFAILATAIGIFSRNHKRCMHNYVVNTNRSQSMESFIQFINTFSDKHANFEGVVLRAIDSIFTPVASGYAAEDTGSDPAPIQIIESLSGRK